MRNTITNYIRAGYPGLFIVSHEEARIEAEIKAAASALKYGLFAWSVTAGLLDVNTGADKGAQDPLEAVQAIAGLPEACIILLRDFHVFLADPNPILVRALKEALAEAKTRGKCVAITGCRLTLPPELEREITALEFTLPDKQQLGVVLDSISQSAKLKKPAHDMRDAILDAAMGLTTTEAETHSPCPWSRARPLLHQSWRGKRRTRSRRTEYSKYARPGSRWTA